MIQEVSLHFRFFRCIIVVSRAAAATAAVVVVVGRRRSRIKAAAAAALEAITCWIGGSEAAIDLCEGDKALHLLSIANRVDQLLCCQMKHCVRILFALPLCCCQSSSLKIPSSTAQAVYPWWSKQQLSPRVFDVVVERLRRSTLVVHFLYTFRSPSLMWFDVGRFPAAAAAAAYLHTKSHDAHTATLIFFARSCWHVHTSSL